MRLTCEEITKIRRNIWAIMGNFNVRNLRKWRGMNQDGSSRREMFGLRC